MNRHLRPTLFILGSLVLGQLGCSTDSTVDLAGPQDSALKNYVAAWDGHAEAYAFDTPNGGTDRVRITVNGDGTGMLRVGDIPLYPAATNFDVGYPVGAKGSSDLFAGVAYPLRNARVDQDRLRFTIDETDPFGEWCAHQTPYGDGSPPPNLYYYCIPLPFITPLDGKCQTGQQQTPIGQTGQQTPVDCLKGWECLGVCNCSATGCVSGAPTGPAGLGLRAIDFDGALEQNGKSLVGTLVVQDDTRVTLRLARP